MTTSAGLLFFRPRPYRLDPAHDAAWNRGAYLAEGLAHCGACHTPRNVFGAERSGAHFAGAEAEGWFADALNADSPAPEPWTVASLAAYLRQGWHPQHGVARGPMAQVSADTAAVPEAEATAIAVYVVSGMAPHRSPAAQAGPSQPAGAAIYAAACAGCHDTGRPLPFGGIDLHLSSAIVGPNPTNLLSVVLNGLPAAEAEPTPIMPGFRAVLDDARLAALLGELRARFAGLPPWPDLSSAIRQARARDATSQPGTAPSAPPARWPSSATAR